MEARLKTGAGGGCCRKNVVIEADIIVKRGKVL